MVTTLELKLKKLKGSKILTIKTRTTVELLKKSRVTKQPCPYQLVERVCERNGIIGCSYENAVNNQREREQHGEEFEAKELWNGKGRRVSEYLVEHIDKPGQLYVTFMARNVDNLPVVANDVWYCDGEEIDPQTIEEYLPATSTSKRQETEKKIIWRTIKIENIIGVKCGSTLTYA